MVKQKTIEDPNKEIWLMRVPRNISVEELKGMKVKLEPGAEGDVVGRLKGAVEKGDFAAVLAEKNAFDLFNSGAYAQKSAITKAQKAIAVTETKNIMEAIASKNANQLKTSYAAYMKNAAIDTKPVDVSTGQGYSNDYDWKVRTKKGAIYQR